MPERPHMPIPELNPQQISEFWSKVAVGDPQECWPWLDDTKWGKGYGRFRIAGVNFKAHRVALFLKTGKDPGELCALHSCDNRPCCNPNHLFRGTNLSNVIDKVLKDRQQKGVEKASAVLNPEKVQQIRKLHLQGYGYRSIAKMYECGRTSIERIITGRNWKHVP